MENTDSVKSIMTDNVISISINSQLKEAKEIFSKHKIRHLPVTLEDRLIGIISHTDLLRISFGNNFTDDEGDTDEAIFDMLSINQVMKYDITTIQADQPIRDAAEVFAKREFHALPVVEGEKLVGILTTTDLINYFLEIIAMSESLEDD